MRRLLSALIVLAVTCPPVQAADTEALFRCGGIADANARLDCYDALVRSLYEKEQRKTARPKKPAGGLAPSSSAAAAGNPAQPTVEITVPDIDAGFLTLRGQIVTAPGILLVTSDDASLYADAGGRQSVSVSLANLDGPSRLAVMQTCARGCVASVTGRLTSAALGPQLVASAIKLR
ncbi:hypothetical protein ACRC7T_01745 [Segnochrobactraceae bacterium EtOH-i3]